MLTGLAPAKINLFLHVGAVGADGYHPLSSLVAFADVGDVVSVERAARLSLDVTGPFAGALGDSDNLILRALRALGEASGIGEPNVRVTLDKRLPIAAGLGGGSSDAGVALRLVRALLDIGIDDAALEAVAAVVGADGAMCVRGRSAWAEGRGDVLRDAPDLPALHAVLANPGVPSPTGTVYAAWDARPLGGDDCPTPPSDWTPGAVIDWLGGCRNDLETPAIGLTPEIGAALKAMAACPGVGLSRMSGSGATVFGLFPDADDARAAAERLSADHGDWWVRLTILGG